MSTTNNLKDSQANVIVGLGSYTHVTTGTGLYFVSAQCLENPASSIIITISQSGSRTFSLSSSAPSSSQEAINLQTLLNCVPGDIITVSLASSSSIDNQLNTVKTIVSLGRR